jgi:hypothetical protein
MVNMTYILPVSDYLLSHIGPITMLIYFILKNETLHLIAFVIILPPLLEQ